MGGESATLGGDTAVQRRGYGLVAGDQHLTLFCASPSVAYTSLFHRADPAVVSQPRPRAAARSTAPARCRRQVITSAPGHRRRRAPCEASADTPPSVGRAMRGGPHHVDRTVTGGRQVLRVERHERAAAKTLDAARITRPDITFSIFEQRGHTDAAAAPIVERHGAGSIDAHDAARRANPHVRRPIADHRQRLNPAERRRQAGCHSLGSIPPGDPAVRADPQLAIGNRQQAVDLLIGKARQAGGDAAIAQAEEAEISRANPQRSRCGSARDDDRRGRCRMSAVRTRHRAV